MSGLDRTSQANSLGREMTWVWLLPVSYLCHLSEEYFGGIGFPQWVSNVTGLHFFNPDFLLLNAIAWTLVTMGATLSVLVVRLRFLAVTIATIFLINAALHLITSIGTRSYSPGVFSGLLIWLPLGIFVLRKMRHKIPPKAFRGGIITGVCAHIVLVIVVFATLR